MMIVKEEGEGNRGLLGLSIMKLGVGVHCGLRNGTQQGIWECLDCVFCFFRSSSKKKKMQRLEIQNSEGQEWTSGREGSEKRGLGHM